MERRPLNSSTHLYICMYVCRPLITFEQIGGFLGVIGVAQQCNKFNFIYSSVQTPQRVL
jgi:hypothetical protein